MRFIIVISWVSLALVFCGPAESRHRRAGRGEPILPQLPPAADDTLWEAHYCKGSQLLDAMFKDDGPAGRLFNPPQSSAKSEWTNFPQLFRDWGYYAHQTEKLMGPEWGDFDRFWGIGNALRGLGVSDKVVSRGGRNGLMYVTHGDPQLKDVNGHYIPLEDQHYQQGGKEYRATGARFGYSINSAEGVIIAQDRKSPKHAGAEFRIPIPDDQLPKLSRSSDISWGMWTLASNGDPERLKNVNYFFSLSITNVPTLVTIARALEDTHQPLLPWPGALFLTDTSEEGKVLLGAPNSVGIAYFLIQYKEALGNLYVYAIRVFQCDNRDKTACMLFAIKAPAV